MIKAPFVDIDYRDSSLAKQYLISNPSAMDILSWCLKWKRGGFTSLANFVEQEGATGMTMSRTLELEYSLPLVEAVNYLVLAVQTQQGRDQFVTVLNQFRSKKVGALALYCIRRFGSVILVLCIFDAASFCAFFFMACKVCIAFVCLMSPGGCWP